MFKGGIKSVILLSVYIYRNLLIAEISKIKQWVTSIILQEAGDNYNHKSGIHCNARKGIVIIPAR